ncbi:MAG: heparinase II/III family protein [Melioribacteraceae bacterium]|nr:heparinase II/III family protein [Melioribacteraceae bacterium]MCF8265138.1 heparinase II/III family protein [Melioribacteraceae bacterium]
MKQRLINSNKIIIVFALLLWAFSNESNAQAESPNLVLTFEAVKEIQASIGSVPLFDKSLESAKSFVENALKNPIEVPVPADAGGGYTHEKHKQNYNEMYQAGILFQITGEEKYGIFIKNMLDQYAELYPTLSAHPQGKRQTPGRLFWQTLNENVWLLHTIQAYDCIQEWLSPKDRQNYIDNIFTPMVKFFMIDCSQSFNLIHNHGTWMVASVGMTGYVLGNQDYVQKALYGSDLDGKSGYLAQLDELFSPSGYYTEGGYYVRYALWPFFIFAEAIHNNEIDLKIYEYRDQILRKALYSALQVTYTNGAFIPINDAIKEKTWLSRELIFATNFVFAHYNQDAELLNLVKLQDEVSLTGPGLEVAKALDDISEIPAFTWKSIEFTDGPKGDWGGVGIIRSGDNSDQETLVMKYGSHGLSHGHFDKLTYLFYDQSREIIQDYGSARFLNVEQKFGGRYLDENDSFAKQTVAHNTVVVDEKSQFDGIRDKSQESHSIRYAFSAQDEQFQFMSAKEKNAYKGVKMHRTMAMVNDEKLYRPVIIDVFRIESDQKHTYDLPFYYKGHFIYSNFEYEAFTKTKSVIGEDSGYQHLWKEAIGKPDKTAQLTWWNGKRFYSIVSNTSTGNEIYFARIGGSDPDFNLRNEPVFIIRARADNYVFASVLEPHGIFDPIAEFTKDSYSSFENVQVILNAEDYTIINLKGKNNIDWNLMISNEDNNPESEHKITFNNVVYEWKGTVGIKK